MGGAVTKPWHWQHIEAGFQNKLKTAAVLVNLSSAFDMVSINGLLLKLAKVIKCKKTINLITSMLSNRLFRVFTGGIGSSTSRLNSVLPQWGVLSPLLFILYLSDLPQIFSRPSLLPFRWWFGSRDTIQIQRVVRKIGYSCSKQWSGKVRTLIRFVEAPSKPSKNRGISISSVKSRSKTNHWCCILRNTNQIQFYANISWYHNGSIIDI